jgi:hypothetical protein
MGSGDAASVAFRASPGCGTMDFSFSPPDEVVRPVSRIVIFGSGTCGLEIQRRRYSQGLSVDENGKACEINEWHAPE